MKILCISDIHDQFEKFYPRSFPYADLCLVAGDLTNFGMLHPEEVERAKDWLRAMGQRCTVLWIPGNHDVAVDQFTLAGIPNVFCALNIDFEMSRFSFESRSVVREARIRGVSLTPCFDMPHLARQWAYMTADPAEDAAAFAFQEVEIVLSHGPPLGVLDTAMPTFAFSEAKISAMGTRQSIDAGEVRHIGSPGLRRYIEQMQPKLVVCGHAHGNVGEEMIGETRVVNVAQTWKQVEL